jgi:hypothetical protein
MSGTAKIPIRKETPSMWPAPVAEEGQRSLNDPKPGEEVRLEQSANVPRFLNCGNQGVASII